MQMSCDSLSVFQRKNSAAYLWCITETFSFDYSMIHGEEKHLIRRIPGYTWFNSREELFNKNKS